MGSAMIQKTSYLLKNRIKQLKTISVKENIYFLFKGVDDITLDLLKRIY